MADSTSLVQDGQNALTRPARLFQLAFIAAALLALYLISTVNFLLFHGIVELAGIAVAFSIFIILWNTRRVVTDGFFLIHGIRSSSSGARCSSTSRRRTSPSSSTS